MSEAPINRPEDVLLQATDVRVKRLSDEIAVVHVRMTLTGQTSVGEVTTPGPARM